jgi:hypothetical protein
MPENLDKLKRTEGGSREFFSTVIPSIGKRERIQIFHSPSAQIELLLQGLRCNDLANPIKRFYGNSVPQFLPKIAHALWYKNFSFEYHVMSH